MVVEGYMDVIALAQHGITYATATLGTATSTTHLERIYRLCPEVVFCFDGDEAGRKRCAAMEAALPCMEDGRQARFLFLPEGEDPDTGAGGGRRDIPATLASLPCRWKISCLSQCTKGWTPAAWMARTTEQARPALHRQLPEGCIGS